MMANVDILFEGEPINWVQTLPEYQRESIEKLLVGGATFAAVAQAWINASPENTYPFSASSNGDKSTFLNSLKLEVRAFLCGDKKYEKEREGFFSEKGPAHSYVVSAIAVAIAPSLNVASTVIAPLIALILASLGKIVLNAWCNT